MATTIANTSKEVLNQMFDDSFDKLDWKMEWLFENYKNIIKTAKEIGLSDKAEELEETAKDLLILYKNDL